MRLVFDVACLFGLSDISQNEDTYEVDTDGGDIAFSVGVICETK